MDLLLGARFFANYGSNRGSVDMMMPQMAQIANRHALGVLIIDEIQHLTLAKGVGPEAILNFLVTLINVIGIPVVMIGTMGAIGSIAGQFSASSPGQWPGRGHLGTVAARAGMKPFRQIPMEVSLDP